MFTEESLDVDPNYDPSDFLMAGLPMCKNEAVKQNISMDDGDTGIKIHDDLAVSESEDEGANMQSSETQQQMQEDDDGGDLWF